MIKILDRNYQKICDLVLYGIRCPGCGQFIQHSVVTIGSLFTTYTEFSCTVGSCGCKIVFNGNKDDLSIGYSVYIESCRNRKAAAKSSGKITLAELLCDIGCGELRVPVAADILHRGELPDYFEETIDIEGEEARFDIVFEIDNCEMLHELESASFNQKTEECTPETSESTSKSVNERKCVDLKNKINLFGTKMELGLSKDPNLVCTMLGVAVRTEDGNLHIYDKEKKKIVNTGDVELGNFPIFLVPDTAIKVGDVIKRDDSNYCFVEKVCDGGRIETVAPKEGEVRTLVPVENLLGWKLYTKVICPLHSFAGGDGIKSLLGDGDDIGKLLMLALVSGGFASDAENTGRVTQEEELPFDMQGMAKLMPLMLLSKSGMFGEGFGTAENSVLDADLCKMLALSSMVNPSGNGANIFSNNGNMLGMLFVAKAIAKNNGQTVNSTVAPAEKHVCDPATAAQPATLVNTTAKEHEEDSESV